MRSSGISEMAGALAYSSPRSGGKSTDVFFFRHRQAEAEFVRVCVVVSVLVNSNQ